MKKPDAFELILMFSGILIPFMNLKYQVGPYSITIIELILLILIPAFLLHVRRNCWNLSTKGWDKLFLALTLWACLSVPKSIEPGKTWREILLLLESAVLFYIVSQGIRDMKALRRMLKFWCLGCITVSAWGIYQYFYLVQSGAKFLGTDHGFASVSLRVNSTFSHANSLSGYLLLFIPILIALVYESRSYKRVFWLVSTVLVVSCLLFTYTRAGWFSSVVSVILFFYLLGDKRFLLAFPVSLIMLSAAFPNVIARLTSILQLGSDLGGLQRVQLWQAAFLMWRDNPLTGVGTGNFYHLLMDYAHRYQHLSQIFEPLEPHNSFIKFLSESGIIGFALFSGIIFLLVKNIVKVYPTIKNTQHRVVFSGVISGGLAFILQSNTNSLFHDPRVAVSFWLLAGLATAAGCQAESVPAGKPEQANTISTTLIASEKWQFIPNGN